MQNTNYLNEFSGFNNLVEIFQKNIDKKWYEWLNVETVFKKSGKQGIVGILSTKENKKVFYVFKISQTINHLINHEISVMKSLNEISNYCPHFCRGVDIIPFKVDLFNKTNPLDLENSKKIILNRELGELFNLSSGQTLNLFTLFNHITNHIIGHYHL